ncbi:MAG: M15 family metallopeptidase [Thiomicrorhabdus sp.]|jgi:hypothetical protein|nr:M15 family metallopeptidase [Thiomicrorhabdus sp.]
MSLSGKQQEFAQCVSELIEYAYKKGYGLTFGDAYRDKRVHGDFGVKESYSAAHSVHKLRLAVDFNLFVDDDYISDGLHPGYKDLGKYWKTLHIDASWGGDFQSNDANHFSFAHWGVE